MSSALYRKYRPQTFAQMIGQNHIKITLQHELERGDIGHAYLCCGPRGLGKTTSARLFAKAVNCEKRQEGESEPCNECPSCLDIMAGRSVDMIEIDAASNTGVENVRENVIENSRFNPVRSKYKVFIIDEVHMLSTHAFNALLKIMEEPPEHVIFILCTTEIHKLPVTIISRCQRFDFKKVTAEQLLKRLELVVKGENKKVETEVLKRIVLASEGCVRDAESLLSKVLSLGDEISTSQAEIVLPRSDYESISNFVMYLSEQNSAAAIELINRLLEEGMDLAIFNDNLLEFLRQMLLVKSSGQLEGYGLELADNLAGAVNDLANRFSWDELVSALEIFADKGKEIKQAAIYQLPLEMAVIKLTQQVSCQKPDEIFFSTSVAMTEEKPLEKKIQPIKVDSAPVDIPAVAAAPAQSIKVAEKAEEIKQLEVSFNDILASWPRIIQKLVKTNFTLGSLLKMSQPLKCDQNVLEVAVASSFLKGRLEATANRQIIEQVIDETLGSRVLIKGVISATVKPLEVEIDYDEKKFISGVLADSQLKPSFASHGDEVLSMF
jgi:DNA polymerase-3 subunit gamma/tau